MKLMQTKKEKKEAVVSESETIQKQLLSLVNNLLTEQDNFRAR